MARWADAVAPSPNHSIATYRRNKALDCDEDPILQTHRPLHWDRERATPLRLPKENATDALSSTSSWRHPKARYLPKRPFPSIPRRGPPSCLPHRKPSLRPCVHAEVEQLRPWPRIAHQKSTYRRGTCSHRNHRKELTSHSPDQKPWKPRDELRARKKDLVPSKWVKVQAGAAGLRPGRSRARKMSASERRIASSDEEASLKFQSAPKH